MITFTGSPAQRPAELSLKAALAWNYLFSDCWVVVKTPDDVFIVTDEACCLDEAQTFPDEDAFVMWLERVADQHLEDDPLPFLRSAVKVPEMLTPTVVAAIREAAQSATSTEPTSSTPPSLATEAAFTTSPAPHSDETAGLEMPEDEMPEDETAERKAP